MRRNCIFVALLIALVSASFQVQGRERWSTDWKRHRRELLFSSDSSDQVEIEEGKTVRIILDDYRPPTPSLNKREPPPEPPSDDSPPEPPSASDYPTPADPAYPPPPVL